MNQVAPPTSAAPSPASVLVVHLDALGVPSIEGHEATLRGVVGAIRLMGTRSPREVRLAPAPAVTWPMVRLLLSVAQRAGPVRVMLASEGGAALAWIADPAPRSGWAERVTLDAGGELHFEGETMTTAELSKRLRARLASPPPRTDVFRVVPHEDGTVEQLRAAVDAVRDAGAVAVVQPAPFEGSGLRPEQISQVVHAREAQLDACRLRGLARNPNAAGCITLRIVIEWDGEVTSAEIARDNFPFLEVGDCIVNSAARWRFPPLTRGNTLIVEYPINLGARRDAPMDCGSELSPWPMP